MYCPNCGEKARPEASYCRSCGVAFYSKKKEKTNSSWFPVVIFAVVLSVIAPVLVSWFMGECGAVNVSRSIQELDRYAGHLAEIEKATIDNVRPPSYLLSQIDGDYIAMSTSSYAECVQPAADSMLNALYRASRYFGDLPVNRVGDDGYPIMLSGEILNRKYQYEDALRSYYGNIEALKACHPFCNFNSLFE
jgi:hypothetical protein